MASAIEARLIELLRSDEEDIFQQGLEMLRSGGWDPRERYLVARALCDKPRRAIAAMADSPCQRRRLEWRFAAGCLRRLAAREAQTERHPPILFTQTLPLLDRLAGGAVPQRLVDEAVLMCRAEIARLRARGRQQTMSFSDPARYAAVRLLEVLADLLEGVGSVEAHAAALVRQLSTLEPRGLVGYEERDRRAMCRAALEAALQAAVSPPSAPSQAPASASAPSRRPPTGS